MNSDLYFDGKQYISSSRAAKISGYVNDYIGQLCRDGKLECRMVGRSWYVSLQSLISHKNANGGNAKSRAKKAVPSLYKKEPFQEVNFYTEGRITPDLYEERIQKKESEESFQGHHVFVSKIVKQDQEAKGHLGLETKAIPLVTEVSTYHSLFEKQFGKVVSFAVAFLFAISGFQFALNINPQSADVYKSIGNAVKSSAVRVASLPENIFVANASSGEINILDKMALSVYRTLHGLLFDTRNIFLVFQGEEEKKGEEKFTQIAQAPRETMGDSQGMVVVPVDEKTDQEKVISKIKESFSDEVQVLPKDDGTSGVITPVFRKASDDDYLYVLVPIKN